MYTREQITTLAEKWLNGTISETEKQAFEHWYNRRKPEEFHWLGNDAEDAVRKRIFELVRVQMAADEAIYPRTPANRFKLLKWAVAAACLVLLTIIVFFGGGSNQQVAGYQPSYTDSAAGAKPPAAVKAIITLADGSEIPLDSIASGNTISQGSGNIRRKSTGELVYSGNTSSVQTLYNKITVPRGSQILSVVLSDGTKVWLNVESSLRYPVVFNGTERKVTLTGEAYFEVQKNTVKKFVVETAESFTEVLGTHFNINSYTLHHDRITLLEGSVKVRNNQRDAQELDPGEQAVVKPVTIQLKQVDDMEAVMAWKNGLFKLNNADIPGIMQQLSQWYDVDVVLKGNLEGKTFSGMISRNTRLSTVLEMLSMTKEVKFTTAGKTITVYPY